jgi:GT2 family glycosyltransferase
MSRPEVSIVMPFAGSPAEAREALQALDALETRPGDELILVDNSGTVSLESLGGEKPGVKVVKASVERSPAHARNAGAAQAAAEWILFLDADVRPRPGLLDAFWSEPIADDVGAVAGEVISSGEAASLASRYGAARSFLAQEAHYNHPFRPRAAAANLLVRRAAFLALGGFYEGLRAAEDTDFTWRLQEAGWRLELRLEAQVEHRYRTTVTELRRQWRGYAAGRAWLARRYDGFAPEPALARAARRTAGRMRRHRQGVTPPAGRAGGTGPPGRVERGRFLALDALLSLEELAGFALSNRPSASQAEDRESAAVVLVADRFPAREDPLVELAESLDRARVEAGSRPRTPDVDRARRLRIDYLEDDGQVVRWAALLHLLARHPSRGLSDLARRPPDAPPLRLLAPAVRRLERDPGARLHALGGGRSRTMAERLARLAGRPLE